MGIAPSADFEASKWSQRTRTLVLGPAVGVMMLLSAASLAWGNVAAADGSPAEAQVALPGRTSAGAELIRGSLLGFAPGSLPVSAHWLRLRRPLAGKLLSAECYPPETGPDPLQGEQWGLARIRAPQAWSRTMGSCSTVIAVVDTGVDYMHPELAFRKVDVCRGWSCITDSRNTLDDNGHGTHVAGIAAANRENSEGIAGVCPRCSVLPVKVLGCNGSGSADCVARGIRYAVDQGAKVVNLSLGSSACSEEIARAVNYAYESGVVIVASAGNSGHGGECPVLVALGIRDSTMVYPGRLNRVIAVAALDTQDEPAPFSSEGTGLDVAAPGVQILSSFPGGSYRRFDGTSMAAPMVAGTVGLILSQNPNLSPSQVRDILARSADNLGTPAWDIQTGWGRVNAEAALRTGALPAVPEPEARCETVAASEDALATASPHQLDLVRRYRQLRDEVLENSSVGRHYTGLFYLYAPEVSRLFFQNPALRAEAALFLASASDEVGALLPGSASSVVLTQDFVDSAEHLVRSLSAVAGPDLRRDLQAEWSALNLRSHVGEDVRAVWRALQSAPVYLPHLYRSLP